MNNITRKLLFRTGLTLMLSSAFLSGRAYEKSKHEEDYVKIEISRDVSRDSTRNKPGYTVRAMLNGEEIRIPHVENILLRSGLDKELKEKDSPNLEKATELMWKEVSGYTNGIIGGPEEIPSQMVRCGIYAGYERWDCGGYGYGYNVSLTLRPNHPNTQTIKAKPTTKPTQKTQTEKENPINWQFAK